MIRNVLLILFAVSSLGSCARTFTLGQGTTSPAEALHRSASPPLLPSPSRIAETFHLDQLRPYFVTLWGEPSHGDTWQLPDLHVTVTFDQRGRAARIAYTRLAGNWTPDTLAGALAANGRGWSRVGSPPSTVSSLARVAGIVPKLDGLYRSQDGATALLTRRLLSLDSPLANERSRIEAERQRKHDRSPENY